jgi:hypothetical protein
LNYCGHGWKKWRAVLNTTIKQRVAIMRRYASVLVSDEGLCLSEPVTSSDLQSATDSHITEDTMPLHYKDQPFKAAHDITGHNCIKHFVFPKYKVYKTSRLSVYIHTVRPISLQSLTDLHTHPNQAATLQMHRQKTITIPRLTFTKHKT